MKEQLTKQDFGLMVALVALVSCFKPDEEYLSEAQIIERCFAPHKLYGKANISSMIDRGLLEFKSLEPEVLSGRTEPDLYIKCPVWDRNNIDSFVYDNSTYIKKLLLDSEECRLYLKEVSQEISACECIEYIEFYAKKSQVFLMHTSHNNAKLKLLLLELPIEKVNSLLWRALKSTNQNLEYVMFPELIDTAFDYYTHYRRLGIEIESYKRPSSIRPSVISGFIEIFRGEA